MKKVFLLGLALATLMTVKPAYSDDVFITTTFEGVGSIVAQQYTHEDQDPWKGNVYVTVLNDSDEAWGDFHFQIFSVGFSVANVFFSATPAPASSQTLDYFTIDNTNPAGHTMDLYFYNDPVLPSQTATFQVYTDNTIDKKRFGLAIYPTPVPEPSALAAFGAGLLGFAGMVLRKKS